MFANDKNYHILNLSVRFCWLNRNNKTLFECARCVEAIFNLEAKNIFFFIVLPDFMCLRDCTHMQTNNVRATLDLLAKNIYNASEGATKHFFYYGHQKYRQFNYLSVNFEH